MILKFKVTDLRGFFLGGGGLGGGLNNNYFVCYCKIQHINSFKDVLILILSSIFSRSLRLFLDEESIMEMSARSVNILNMSNRYQSIESVKFLT